MGENRVYIFIKILMCIPQCPLRSYYMYLNKHSIDMLVDIASNLILLFCGTHNPLSSSDTQGRFRSLHQPLGKLVEFSSMYRWINTIISLVSSPFSDEQWKRSLQESGYLIGPHAITLCIDFREQIQSFSSFPRGRCSERNHTWVSKDDHLPGRVIALLPTFNL